MMSSLETSSPVSASTFAYLMRWPVLRLIWLKLIFSESDVAGYKATGQVTRERRRKPFQLARGAIQVLHATELGCKTILPHWFRHSIGAFRRRNTIPSGLPICSFFVLIGNGRRQRAVNHQVVESPAPSRTGRPSDGGCASAD